MDNCELDTKTLTGILRFAATQEIAQVPATVKHFAITKS